MIPFNIPLTGKKIATLVIPLELNAKDLELLERWFALIEEADTYEESTVHVAWTVDSETKDTTP